MKKNSFLRKKNKALRKVVTQKNIQPEIDSQHNMSNIVQDKHELAAHRKDIINRFLSSTKIKKKFSQPNRNPLQKSLSKHSQQPLDLKIAQLERIRVDNSRRVKTQCHNVIFIQGLETENIKRQEMKKNKKTQVNMKVIDINENMPFMNNNKKYQHTKFTRNLKLQQEIKMKKNISPYSRKKKLSSTIRDIFNQTTVVFPTSELEKSFHVIEKKRQISQINSTNIWIQNFKAKTRSTEKYQIPKTHKQF